MKAVEQALSDVEIGLAPEVYEGLLASEAVRLERLPDTLNKIRQLMQGLDNWRAAKQQEYARRIRRHGPSGEPRRVVPCKRLHTNSRRRSWDLRS